VDYVVQYEDGCLVEIVLKSGERIYNAPLEPERTEAPCEKRRATMSVFDPATHRCRECGVRVGVTHVAVCWNCDTLE
jgi:hypothetical protein